MLQHSGVWKQMQNIIITEGLGMLIENEICIGFRPGPLVHSIDVEQSVPLNRFDYVRAI